MKSALTVLFLILAVSALPVLAATESQYLVVVGSSAPASDVVLGANFAASMKGTLGVTFSSAIDTDLYAQISEEELRAKTVVVIDGDEREVRILGTSNAAAAADAYFARQGFETVIITSAEREDVLVEQDQPAAQPEPQPEPEPEPQENPREEPAEQAVILEAEVQQPAQDIPVAVPAPRENNGLFSRIANWFKSIF